MFFVSKKRQARRWSGGNWDSPWKFGSGGVGCDLHSSRSPCRYNPTAVLLLCGRGYSGYDISLLSSRRTPQCYGNSSGYTSERNNISLAEWWGTDFARLSNAGYVFGYEFKYQNLPMIRRINLRRNDRWGLFSEIIVSNLLLRTNVLNANAIHDSVVFLFNIRYFFGI